MRDHWIANVGPSFIEAASGLLAPGETALVAEVEEDWVTPVDAAMEALGGAVIRRAAMDDVRDQFDQGILAIRTEITGLETECKHVSGAAQTHLQARLSASRAGSKPGWSLSGAYRARSAKLTRARGLTKEALSVQA